MIASHTLWLRTETVSHPSGNTILMTNVLKVCVEPYRVGHCLELFITGLG